MAVVLLQVVHASTARCTSIEPTPIHVVAEQTIVAGEVIVGAVEDLHIRVLGIPIFCGRKMIADVAVAYRGGGSQWKVWLHPEVPIPMVGKRYLLLGSRVPAKNEVVSWWRSVRIAAANRCAKTLEAAVYPFPLTLVEMRQIQGVDHLVTKLQPAIPYVDWEQEGPEWVVDWDLVRPDIVELFGK